MSCIRDSPVAIDTNVFLFAIRGDVHRRACAELAFDRLGALHLVIPLQVYLEVKRNLRGDELTRFFEAVELAADTRQDFAPADPLRVTHWQRQGAKKGDAIMTAQLVASGAAFLVSENRHFLAEVKDLPFVVMSSQDAIRSFDEDGN